MKVGYYCESPADQAAMAVFVEGILGAPPERISMDLEAHSVPGFFSALGGVLRGVHYNSDADGLVVAVDCDDSPLHEANHEPATHAAQGCRRCRIQQIVDLVRGQLKPVGGKGRLKVAIGTALPAIEAWYLVGKETGVGEAAWRASPYPPFTRPRLKELVYGTDRPSLELEIERAVTEARRIIARIDAIETTFPLGFKLMAEEIRSWRT